jgi:hypothetical protein
MHFVCAWCQSEEEPRVLRTEPPDTRITIRITICVICPDHATAWLANARRAWHRWFREDALTAVAWALIGLSLVLYVGWMYLAVFPEIL